jgi:hypothetical protein
VVWHHVAVPALHSCLAWEPPCKELAQTGDLVGDGKLPKVTHVKLSSARWLQWEPWLSKEVERTWQVV